MIDLEFSHVDDGEIDDVVDRIQERCANINRIEHIGIHSVDQFLWKRISSVLII